MNKPQPEFRFYLTAEMSNAEMIALIKPWLVSIRFITDIMGNEMWVVDYTFDGNVYTGEECETLDDALLHGLRCVEVLVRKYGTSVTADRWVRDTLVNPEELDDINFDWD